MADPHFAKTLTYHLRAQRAGRAGLVVNRPTRHDAWPGCSSRSTSGLTTSAAAAAGALRRPGADRPRLRAAPAGRQLAVHAAVTDGHRPDHLQGHPAGGGARRRAGPDPGHAGLRRLGARASSRTSSRRTPGSPSPATRVMFDLPAEAAAAAAMELLGVDFASLSETRPGMREHGDRAPSRRHLSGARVRFRREAHRRRRRRTGARHRASADAPSTPRTTQRRFAAIDALIAEWQPAPLVVGLPLAHRRHRARDHAPARASSPRDSTARFGLPVELVDERLSSAAADGALREAGVKRRQQAQSRGRSQLAAQSSCRTTSISPTDARSNADEAARRRSSC